MMRRPWSDSDRSTAFALVAAGASNAQIAAELGRKPDAVRAWLHHNTRTWREPMKIDPPRAVVARLDVPQWYELGWRVEAINGPSCALIWTSSKEPVQPI